MADAFVTEADGMIFLSTGDVKLGRALSLSTQMAQWRPTEQALPLMLA